MEPDLEPAKKVLHTFLTEIEAVKGFRSGFSSQSSGANESAIDVGEFEFASDFYWEKEDAYILLYAEAWHFHSLMHRPKASSIPEYYQQPAGPVYLQWRNEQKEIFHRKTCFIPVPGDVELGEYLRQLSNLIVDDNEKRCNWIKSLRSFLQFIRDDTDIEQQGALEVIFPYKMEIRPGYTFKHTKDGVQKVDRRSILRRVDDAVFPIDILAATEIIKNLIETTLEGRSNSQQSAAEALGFALLCHAVSSYRIITREEIVFDTPITALKSPDPTKPEDFFKPEYFIRIKSLYGIIDVPISKTLHDLLIALPRDPTNSNIFSMDWETVLRTFRNKGVKLSKRAKNLGKITFLTFLSQPHEAIGHRHSPMKTPTKSTKKQTVTHRAT